MAEMAQKARAAYEADVAMRPYYHDGSPRKSWDELDEVAQMSWGRPAPPPDDLQREPPADDDYWFPKYEALSKKCGDLRARVAALDAREKRLVAALEPFARHANNKLVADAAFMKQAVSVNYGGSSFALPAVYFKDARAELDAMKGGGDA